MIGDVMSFKAINDINNSVDEKVQSFRRKNVQISMPREMKSHIDSISARSRHYMAEFAQVNAEAKAHQDGGQLRNIDSPKNMTAPTNFMQNVYHIQTERKQTMTQKSTEIKQERESIKTRKKEADEDIRRLYDSLVSEFQEMRTVSS